MKAKLVLENGLIFDGISFGAEGETFGEVVFNTSLTGYQEILTDPSYCGQIVTMTYPLIGNYGVNLEDFESERPFVRGFIVKEYFDAYSNWRANESLADYLKRNNIVGIQGIDTRMLTRVIRDEGAMRGIISTIDLDNNSLKEKVLNSPKMKGLDLAKEVTTRKFYKWTEKSNSPLSLKSNFPVDDSERYHVVVYDYGIKRNILRRLAYYGCNLTVVSANTSWKEVLELNPDGVFLSNGPGDPEPVTYAIENIKNLIGKKPIFGICLGHQLLGLALGGKTYKLKFGHRGGNHPVKNLITNTIEITSQNHGFAVDLDSFNSDMELTHVNLNDNTVEGFRHKSIPLFSVQYHPEASPGPHDSDYLFHDFIEMMKNSK
ncbi:MAG TPA: glutamine-hydrolyzing carbamoyl-phosphate synthase small subunit [Bacteroidota bacterium]|nr:glutamine-hydrolyzing carbamoyl-phosphate synthase small subunit [Bacteroidota bacterium]